MIDVEIDVFDYVYKALEGLVPEGCVSAEYIPAPPALPFVTLIEMDNYTDMDLRGTANQEEFAVVTYELNVYSESKLECRDIANAVDEAMTQLGFARVSFRTISNLADPSIHRRVGRYRAGVNQNKTVFRK